MTIDEIQREMLKLPAPERARLARELLDSLDGEAEIEEAWYEEAERRMVELEDGTVDAIPAEEVRIKRRDGTEFVLRPLETGGSPLDVAGVDTDLTRDEILEAVRESRRGGSPPDDSETS